MTSAAPVRAFIDTNVLIYWVDSGPRADIVEALLAGQAVISVQVLNEFANVLFKKRRMPLAAIRELSDTLAQTCEIAELTLRIHQNALDLAQRYSLSIYDANILAAALAHRCEILYTEDMQHGLAVFAQSSARTKARSGVKAALSIRNPFAAG